MLNPSGGLLPKKVEHEQSTNHQKEEDGGQDRLESATQLPSDSEADSLRGCQWSSWSQRLKKTDITKVDCDHSNNVPFSSGQSVSDDSESGLPAIQDNPLANSRRRPLYRSKSISFIPNSGSWRSSIKRRCHEDFTNPSPKSHRNAVVSLESPASCNYTLDLTTLKSKHGELSSSLCKVQAELEALKLSIQVKKDTTVDYVPGTITDAVKELYVAQKEWQSAMMSRLKLSEEKQEERLKDVASRLGCCKNFEELGHNRLSDIGTELLSFESPDSVLSPMVVCPEEPLARLKMSLHRLQTSSPVSSAGHSSICLSGASSAMSSSPDNGLEPTTSKSSANGLSLHSATRLRASNRMALVASSSMVAKQSKRSFVYRCQPEKGYGPKRSHRKARLSSATRATNFDTEAKYQRLERLVVMLRKKMRAT